MIKLGAWRPDAPDLENSGELTDCKNCVSDHDSYKSFPTPVVWSSALDSSASGSWSGFADNGQARTVVGTVNKLWDASNLPVFDASGMVYSAYLPTAAWYYARFGQYLYATNGVDPVQRIALNSMGTFANAFTNPKGRYMCVAKSFLVLAYTNDTTDGEKNQRVWWSSIGDPTQFPTPGGVTANQTQSGYVDLNDAEGGAIMAIYGGDDLTIMLERSIWKGQYIGGNFVWQFTRTDASHGLFIARCSIRVGGTIYFLDQTGFFASQGGAPAQPIGAGIVDKYFFANSSAGYRYLSYTAFKPDEPIIIWMFPSVSATGCDAGLTYNIYTRKWTRLVMTDQYLFWSAFSNPALTLEDLDAYGNMDTLPYSLDSPYWMGGGGVRGVLTGFDTSFRITRYTGTALAAVIETQETEFFPGRRTQINGIRPVVNGGPTVTVQIGYRKLQSESVSYTTAKGVNSATGWHNTRKGARYNRIRVSTSGAFTHLVGYDVDVVDGGFR